MYNSVPLASRHPLHMKDYFHANPEKKEMKMQKVKVNEKAPDFVLNDFNGKEVSLSAYRNRKNVLLVFNRGFL